jgi:RNA repair pathway DNA polymerase beta family
MNRILEQAHIIKQAHQHSPGKLIYLALQGSRLYGTFRADSDYDLRGVFLPPLLDLLDSRQKDALSFSLQDEKLGHCEITRVEITLWSFPFWLRLLHSGDTNATDLYFASTHSNGVWLETEELKHFRRNYAAKDFLPRDLKGMRGYVRSQALKYGAKGKHFQAGQLVLDAALKCNKDNPDSKVRAFWGEFVGSSEGRVVLRDFADDVRLIKTPDNRDALSVLEKVFYLESPLHLMVSSLTPIVNAYGHRARAALGGADWKALSHSVRVLDEVIELHRTGQVIFPLGRAELLAKIKHGELSQDEVVVMLEGLEQEASQAEMGSVLSSQGNRELLDKALLEVFT